MRPWMEDAIDVASAGHAVGLTADAPALLCQLYSRAVASDVKLTLMQQYPEDWEVGPWQITPATS